ncbi:unnamed protein product [Symbiodinium natans]|uniref:Uncharacterized protein n=1 Tax=Symbiodinium natans TaxID=878477 RepID=A0A812V2M4_9DINO|nr:unnamed protein product [Symbiodinium natans]
MLQTRAGTDSLTAMLRAAVELDPETSVISFDERVYYVVTTSARLEHLLQVVPQEFQNARLQRGRWASLPPEQRGSVALGVPAAQAESRFVAAFCKRLRGCLTSNAPTELTICHRDSSCVVSAKTGYLDCHQMSREPWRAPAKSAIRDLQADLGPDEQAMAYLDDAYISAPPHRVTQLYHRLEAHSTAACQLRLNPAKTRVWNSGGAYPEGVQSLAPDSEVWVGDRALASNQCGIVALGIPLGTPEFVAAHLVALSSV